MRRISVHAAAPVAIAALWALSIRHVRLGSMNDFGLISVLPPASLLLLLLLTESFVVALVRRQLHEIDVLVHVLVLIVVLYGVTAFLEPVPRFSSVYRHVGIIDYIVGHRSVNPGIDAYFNWPGFFTLGALITKAAGFHSAIALAAWGALAFNLLFLPPLYAIFSWASDDLRVRWLAIWVFYSCNWVGQDYLSPQAVGFLLWLAMLAALLRWFVPRPATLPPAATLRRVAADFGPRALRALPVDGPPAAAVQRGGVLLLFLVMYGASVSGHQLTPFPAVLVVAALAAFAGLRTRRLPVLMAIGLAAWLSYMTTAYLSGHLNTIAGAFGSVQQNIGANLGSRLAGSHDHELIVNVRLLVSAAIWGLGVAGFARRFAWRRADLAIALAGAVPAVLPIVQPYGGEMLLRVFLFALPSVSFFIASLPFPEGRAGRTPLTTLAVFVTACALLFAFQFTRYGNERMDRFTTGDTQVVNALYRIAPLGSVLYAGNDNLPWRGRHYDAYTYREISNLSEYSLRHVDSAALLTDLRQRLAARATHGYVIITRSNEVAAELLDGKGGVLQGLVREMQQTPAAATLRYHGGGGFIFYVTALEPQHRPTAAAPSRRHHPTAKPRHPRRRPTAKPRHPRRRPTAKPRHRHRPTVKAPRRRHRVSASARRAAGRRGAARRRRS